MPSSTLGFSARTLSDLGKAASPAPGDAQALQTYRDQLDLRSYQLNAASLRLTNEIRKVWYPNPNGLRPTGFVWLRTNST